MPLVTGDYLLLVYIVLIVPAMLIGYTFARQKQFTPQHKFTMTGIVLLNWAFILFVMLRTYSAAVEPNLSTGLTRANVFIPTLHGLFGLAAQLLASYLVIRMWFEDQLPDWFKVKNIKRYMRTTLVLWFLTIAFGILTWGVIDHGFLMPVAAQSGTQPIATEQATREATSAAAANGTAQATAAGTMAATQLATPATTSQATQPATPAATSQATIAPTAVSTAAATKAL